MLGLFPLAGAPIAGFGATPSTNGGKAGGTSTITASGAVAGTASGNGNSALAAAGDVVGGGSAGGSTVASAYQRMAQGGGSSTLTAAGQVVGRGLAGGASALSTLIASIIAGGSAGGTSDVLAFAFYPAYKKWEPETLLFNFGGALIDESDSAFEQAGRVVFAAQRTNLTRKEIWLYWFDPLVARFIFEYVCPGRNPRVLLDDPFDTTNSDVLLFYIRESDQRVVYRQQRDRYLIEYDTPIAKVPNSYIDLYLQDVVKDRSGRLVVVVAWHTINTGRWKYDRLESALYPFVLPFESITASALFTTAGALEFARKSVYILGELPPTLDGVPSGWIDFESYTASITFLPSGLLNVVLIEAGPHGTLRGNGLPVLYETDVESFKASVVFQSGSLPIVIYSNVLYDIDAFKASIVYLSGTLIKVVIDAILYDIDAFKASSTFLATGSSLAP